MGIESTTEDRLSVELENLLRSRDPNANISKSTAAILAGQVQGSSSDSNDANSLPALDMSSPPGSIDSATSDFFAQNEQFWRLTIGSGREEPSSMLYSRSPSMSDDATSKVAHSSWPRNLPPMGVLRHL